MFGIGRQHPLDEPLRVLQPLRVRLVPSRRIKPPQPRDGDGVAESKGLCGQKRRHSGLAILGGGCFVRRGAFSFCFHHTGQSIGSSCAAKSLHQPVGRERPDHLMKGMLDAAAVRRGVEKKLVRMSPMRSVLIAEWEVQHERTRLAERRDRTAILEEDWLGEQARPRHVSIVVSKRCVCGGKNIFGSRRRNEICRMLPDRLSPEAAQSDIASLILL